MKIAFWFDMKIWFALLAFWFSTSVNAQEWPTLSYIKQIQQIEVILDDQATGACWTNLRETREYTEEKIRMAGGRVYQTGARYWPDYYSLMVTVRSNRLSNGTCFGLILVDLKTGAVVNGKAHSASALSITNYFTGAPNANNFVISLVQDFFTEKSAY